MSPAVELSAVLPALDEEEPLRALLPRLRAVFERLGVRGEILVVDGGSSDATASVARQAGARVLRQQGRGFGAALREGLLAAAGPWIVSLDADGSHPPETLAALWARRGDAELVVASRYCPGGSAQMPLSRQLLSRALNAATRLLLRLPVRDSSSGFRLYRADLARAACAGSSASDFAVQQELLSGVLARGARSLELPFRYEPRAQGASKASALRLAPSYLRVLARLSRR